MSKPKPFQFGHKVAPKPPKHEMSEKQMERQLTLFFGGIILMFVSLFFAMKYLKTIF